MHQDKGLKKRTMKMISATRRKMRPAQPESLGGCEEEDIFRRVQGGFFDAHLQCGVVMHGEGLGQSLVRPRELIINRIHTVSARVVAFTV